MNAPINGTTYDVSLFLFLKLINKNVFKQTALDVKSCVNLGKLLNPVSVSSSVST